MKKHTEGSRSYISDGILLLVAAIWGGGFVAGKFALESFTPAAILFYRFAAAAAVTFVFAVIRKIKISGKAVLYGVITGFIQFSGLIIQLTGLQYTTSAKQSFLAATYVIFTPFITWAVLRRKPSAAEGVCAVMALAGTGLISLNSAENIQWGDFITLGFALMFSVQIVCVDVFSKKEDPVAFTAVQFAAAAVMSALMVIISGDAFCAASEPVSYAALGYLALINTALAICLQNHAQKRSDGNRASLILSMESVFGFLFSVLIFRDHLTFKVMAGMVLILAALLFSGRKKDRKEQV